MCHVRVWLCVCHVISCVWLCLSQEGVRPYHTEHSIAQGKLRHFAVLADRIADNTVCVAALTGQLRHAATLILAVRHYPHLFREEICQCCVHVMVFQSRDVDIACRYATGRR